MAELPGRAIPWSTLAEFADIDPYLAWADGTLFAGTPAGAAPTQLPFLIRLERMRREMPAAALRAAAFTASGASALYRSSSSAMYSDAAFVTGHVDIASVLNLRPGQRVNLGTPLAPIWWLIDLAGVMSLPRVAETDPSIPAVTFVERPFDPGQSPLIAIIDDGCPFANAAYRHDVAGESCTRVVRLWDQDSEHVEDDPGGARWKAVDGFGYGREIWGNRLDTVMREVEAEHGHVVEDECYRRLGMTSLHGARFAHGAHVMGLAAGAPNPLAVPDGSKLALDEASTAGIIFVQLPRETMRDTSGGSLARHVVDALRYIDLHASVLDRGSGAMVRRPVVVNLSVGAAAGPHDGHSLVEEAIDNFVSQRPACAVLVAAGNARSRAMHKRLNLPPLGTASLAWHIAPDDGTDSFMELWLPREDDEGLAPRVSVKLVPPDMAQGECLSADVGQTAFLLNEDAATASAAICGLVNVRNTSNSRSGNVVLCAVAPTAGDAESTAPGRPLAKAGEWTVEVTNREDRSVDIAAWIERDEPAFGGLGRQSDFDPTTAALQNDQTLSSLAHGDTTIVVGGYRARPEPRLDTHSGEGPGRFNAGRIGPDLIAPSTESPELPGLLSYGVHSEEFNRLAGTSVATAVATRWLYNEWAADPGLIGDWQHVKDHLQVHDERRTEPETRVGRGRIRAPGW